jgi:hypothetical protein
MRGSLPTDRHGFLDQHVLAARCRSAGVLGVMLMRRRHIDGFDRRVGAKRFDRVERPAAELALEPAPRLRARIGGGDQLDAGVGRKRRDHQREGAAESGDAEFEPRRASHRVNRACVVAARRLRYLDL